jgi:hypothetical protein
MPASSQRQAGEVSWLDSGACPSCLMMRCAVRARESVDGLHKSRKLQSTTPQMRQVIESSMAVSAVTSAVVLYLALAATQTQLPIAAFSSKPRDSSARQQHVSLLTSSYLSMDIYQCRTRMLVRATLHFRHCKVTWPALWGFLEA